MSYNEYPGIEPTESTENTADVLLKLMDGADLNKRQYQFVLNYLKLLNGTQSAIAAGYSQKNASSTASRLLRVPEIARVVRTYTEMMVMESDEVQVRLARHARVDMGDFISIDDEGQPKFDLGKAFSRGVTDQINKLTITTQERNGVVETKVNLGLVDSQKALKQIARYLGLEKMSLKPDFDMAQMSDDELKRIIEGGQNIGI